jgi:protein arginine kinase
MLNNIRWLVPETESAMPCEDKEIVVSSRVRVARNLEGVPFEIKIKAKDAQRLLDLTRSVIENRLRGKFFDLHKLTPLERESLLECHLISPGFLKEDRPAGVFISENTRLSVMINEEDHLRFQGLSCGLNLAGVSGDVFDAEENLGADLGFAYHETYGYLTSCPTNLGTGMRASILLHLPGLVFTSEVEKALKGATNLGINIRGIYGEGTEIRGNLFQISNQHTLGLKEEDLIETMTKFARMIIDVETKTRDIILKKARIEFEDKVARSLAILRSARVLSSNEVLNLLSAVRMGIGLGIIKDVTLDKVNEIMLVSRPANLQIHFGEILEEHERDIRRADYVRQRLAEEKKPEHRESGAPGS